MQLWRAKRQNDLRRRQRQANPDIQPPELSCRRMLKWRFTSRWLGVQLQSALAAQAVSAPKYMKIQDECVPITGGARLVGSHIGSVTAQGS
jgi:hypothetical protein